MVTSEQPPHLLPSLTSFGPQGHKIPAEIQPRISLDECAAYRATCDRSSLEKYICGSSPHLTTEHQKLTTPDTKSLYGTNGPEKNPCDEARDFWENRKGRWVRVHGIARRTLFDPMHDEQPFCQGLTERRRTTVRFLGQQSEVTIDDTWPQAGEMRNLWKGITEFWTDDMPQDATWRPNRHHSNIIPLFCNHVIQSAVAMFPPLPSHVISVEQGSRDSRLSAVPHTENAEGMSELSNVYSSHHFEPSGTAESQDAATEAADPSCQRQDTSKGMSTPPGQALGKRHGKGKYVSAAWSQHQRQGRDHGNQQVHTAEMGVQRGEAPFQPKGGGTYRAGFGAGRGRRSQEVAGRSPCGSPSSPEQSNRRRFLGGTSNGGDGTDQETVESELGTSRSMTAGQKKRLLGGIKKTRAMWERWCEAILEEEKLQDIRMQCVDFCEAMTSKVHAVLQHATFDLRGGTFRQQPRVLVATVDYQEKPHLCMQTLHAAVFQIS